MLFLKKCPYFVTFIVKKLFFVKHTFFNSPKVFGEFEFLLSIIYSIMQITLFLKHCLMAFFGHFLPVNSIIDSSVQFQKGTELAGGSRVGVITR